MVLEVKDHAYFGCFNLNTLRDMRALRYLELRVENGLRYSWGTEGGAAPDILKDFRAEVVDWPDWQVPEIRIVEGTTGSELVVIRGRGDLVDEDSEV